MNNKGKNKSILSTEDVKGGKALIELGKLASISIITEGSAHFVVEDNKVIQCDPRYTVDIGGLDEETALKVLILLGRTDKELEDFLRFRQSSGVPF